MTAGRHVMPEQLTIAARQLHRQRIDDAAGEGVLQLKDVAAARLREPRPQHGAVRHVQELCADANLVPAMQQRPLENRIDVRPRRNRLQIGRIVGEPRRCRRRSDGERFEPAQRVRNRVRDAEREKVVLEPSRRILNGSTSNRDTRACPVGPLDAVCRARRHRRPRRSLARRPQNGIPALAP